MVLKPFTPRDGDPATYLCACRVVGASTSSPFDGGVLMHTFVGRARMSVLTSVALRSTYCSPCSLQSAELCTRVAAFTSFSATFMRVLRANARGAHTLARVNDLPRLPSLWGPRPSRSRVTPRGKRRSLQLCSTRDLHGSQGRTSKTSHRQIRSRPRGGALSTPAHSPSPVRMSAAPTGALGTAAAAVVAGTASPSRPVVCNT